VAERKVRTLLRAGAAVTVVSPKISSGLHRRHTRSEIQWVARNFRPGDLRGAALALAATDDEQVQDSIMREAGRRGVPVNLADRAEGSDFLVPAVLSKGEVQIAISTSGASPALARTLRLQLENALAKVPESLADLRRLRGELKEQTPSAPARAKALRKAARAALKKGRLARTQPGVPKS
jgi:precorrin-2 dehydrogenase